jgi:hypothetical protein
MEMMALRAPALAARSKADLRALAQAVAVSHAEPPLALAARAAAAVAPDIAAGRVISAGRWQDDAVGDALRACLAPPLGEALREGFEWYVCRGAHFHNDAHYADVLFGIWTVAGPAMDVVFPRAALRVAAGPGRVLVFDPFEVHGVLAPGARRYDATDYADAAASVFVGFELALTHAVRHVFGIGDVPDGRVVSSTTRIAADSGTFVD